MAYFGRKFIVFDRCSWESRTIRCYFAENILGKLLGEIKNTV